MLKAQTRESANFPVRPLPAHADNAPVRSSSKIVAKSNL